VVALNTNGVGVQTASASSPAWSVLTDNVVGTVLSTRAICQALAPRCLMIASFNVQMRQKAANCCSGASAAICACSCALNGFSARLR